MENNTNPRGRRAERAAHGGAAEGNALLFSIWQWKSRRKKLFVPKQALAVGALTVLYSKGAMKGLRVPSLIFYCKNHEFVTPTFKNP